LIDVCLAHAVGSEALRRYKRGNEAELWRTAMPRWSGHLDGC
jgi:hypothetical protein